MNDNPENGVTAGTAPTPLKPCCGNCRFTVPVANDFLKIECHWGPPAPSMVAMPTGRPGQMGIQQMCSFPVLPRTFHCFRHEPQPVPFRGQTTQ